MPRGSRPSSTLRADRPGGARRRVSQDRLDDVRSGSPGPTGRARARSSASVVAKECSCINHTADGKHAGFPSRGRVRLGMSGGHRRMQVKTPHVRRVRVTSEEAANSVFPGCEGQRQGCAQYRAYSHKLAETVPLRAPSFRPIAIHSPIRSASRGKVREPRVAAYRRVDPEGQDRSRQRRRLPE